MGKRLLLLGVLAAAAVAATASPAAAEPCAFDIWVVALGYDADLTDSPDACEFNPDWSADGRRIAYDHIDDGGQQLWVYDLLRRTAGRLAGTPVGANNAAYSPNGRWLAFDRFFEGDATEYLVPATGGTPVPLLTDAGDADWSPSSQQLVFSRPSDESVWTYDLQTQHQTRLAWQGCGGFQCGVAWSPAGDLVAYSGGLDLWTIAVTPTGEPAGAPSLLTPFGPYFHSQPAFTPDGRAILFTSDRGNNGRHELWRIPIAGGEPVAIRGVGSQFSYDPAVAWYGLVAYAGSTG